MRTGKKKRKKIDEVFSLSLELMQGNFVQKLKHDRTIWGYNTIYLREWITPAVATWILDKLVHGLNNSGNPKQIVNCTIEHNYKYLFKMH